MKESHTAAGANTHSPCFLIIHFIFSYPLRSSSCGPVLSYPHFTAL